VIKINNIEIGYDKTLLKIASINLVEGQCYVLIGKNGSGKTTFLKTLTCELKPIMGEINIQSKTLSELTTAEISKTIAFVASTFPKSPYVRVDEYIGLGRSPYTNSFGKLKSDDNEMIEEAIEALDITHLKGKFTNELSDGERQLVAIARALSQQTKYIFLDEPLAFLDYSNRKIVLEKLSELAKNKGKCVIFSSHDVDTILDYQFEFLLVHSKDSQIGQYGKPTTKEEIVQVCFE
jgi:iron complex transport system ATP-binding protein